MDVATKLIAVIFIAGLAKLIFGSNSAAGAPGAEEEEERYGPGYYHTRYDAERAGAFVADEGDAHDGPGYYS